MWRTLVHGVAVAGIVGGIVGAAVLRAFAAPTTPPAYHVIGAVVRVESPTQYIGTDSLNNVGISVTNPAFFVVMGVERNGQWQYPFSVSVAGATVAAIPLAVNLIAHTELVEVGLPTNTLLKLANPISGGTSQQSSSVPNRP